MVASEAAAETIWLVAKEQSKYWKNVDPKACEAHEGMSICNLPLPSQVLRVFVSDAGALSFSVTGLCYSAFFTHLPLRPIFSRNT
jgi:hypothetical protein